MILVESITNSKQSSRGSAAGFSLNERASMTSHADAITALALLQMPHVMLASGSRDGSIKIWR
jgi:hypothetical protein